MDGSLLSENGAKALPTFLYNFNPPTKVDGNKKIKVKLKLPLPCNQNCKMEIATGFSQQTKKRIKNMSFIPKS